MAELRNKRKLTAFNKESQDEHPRKNESGDTKAPRFNEDYFTKLSEKN